VPPNYLSPMPRSSLPHRSSWPPREGDNHTSPRCRLLPDLELCAALSPTTRPGLRAALPTEAAPVRPLPYLRHHEQVQAEQPRSRSAGGHVKSLVVWRGCPRRKEVRRPYHYTRSSSVAAHRVHTRIKAGIEISATELHFPSPLAGFGGLGCTARLGLTVVVIEPPRPTPPWGLLQDQQHGVPPPPPGGGRGPPVSRGRI
jgi:hypothetical protein